LVSEIRTYWLNSLAPTYSLVYEFKAIDQSPEFTIEI